MSKITREELENIARQPKKEEKNWIKVGMSSCGIAAGAGEIYEVFAEQIKKRNLPIAVKKCGCVGMCYAEPLVEVAIEGMPTVTYGRVTREGAIHILEEHINDKRLINDHIYDIKFRK